MEICKFRWKRFALIALPLSALILFPIWHRWVQPGFYADVRCVKQGENGEVIKATGEDCFGSAPASGQTVDR